ncbi:MAG: hypothetical protein ACREPI_03670 [Candidatus Dormibacterales bacterium]
MLAAALGALALAGCGQPATGRIIAVRSAVTAAPQPQTIDAAALTQRIAQDLAQADSVGSIPGGDHLTGSLLPITSNLSVPASERLLALEQQGLALIDARLNDLSTLENLVTTSTHISPPVRALLLSRLAYAYNGLSSLRATIAGETLLDQTRAALRNIDGTYHVLGVLDPQVRMMAAADGILQLAALDTTQLAGLNRKLAQDQRAGVGTGDAAGLLADMSNRIRTMTQEADQALSTLAGVDPSQYPANQPTLTAMHNLLNSAHAAASLAAADATNARTAMP